jgi:hypothetical protein
MKLTCIPLYAVRSTGSTVENEYDGIVSIEPGIGKHTVLFRQPLSFTEAASPHHHAKAAQSERSHMHTARLRQRQRSL